VNNRFNITISYIYILKKPCLNWTKNGTNYSTSRRNNEKCYKIIPQRYMAIKKKVLK
jgi:hypothetical protein